MRIPADLAILSDLDGTLTDSTASTVAAYRWWAELRGLSPSVIDRIPFGRTSADAAADLAPHLNAEAEGRLLDARQAEDTAGVVALPGAADLLASHERLAVVTSGSRRPTQRPADGSRGARNCRPRPDRDQARAPRHRSEHSLSRVVGVFGP